MKLFMKNVLFLLICSIGGLILTMAGLSIGWMIGTLITAGAFSLIRPRLLRKIQDERGLGSYWLKIGQLILGVQIGHQVHLSLFAVFHRGWLPISTMILMSIILALLSGFVLFRFSQTSLITSLYGTTPGGLSSMIGIAAESGANMAVVSMIQTLRVILVESTIPFTVSLLAVHVHESASDSAVAPVSALRPEAAFGLAFLLLLACLGALAGSRLHMPAPWLLGALISVAAAQTLFEYITARDFPVWQPPALIIAAQIMLGACVGARLYPGMFRGITRAFLVGLAGSVGLTAAMFLGALLVSALTTVDPVTCVLAFAPGGIDVMAITSEVLHADSTFVVAVQVLRVLVICMLLPPFFNQIQRKREQQNQKKITSG
ncbi:AbrB family transcriptional regulator [Sporolactobacillus sp. CPB3-1]|uniref:AbrB family transcriptional regulator n=1 Tax=Sporolactobacillus mangiferae TaxID=2940498 RepID=A0ABT0MBS0_9BACL|nr:AbrB family transcriptional regulator [Sporolactobacillus mangiferae]MCL1632327.1 AbrB family transcriptional regulator [Sporolactobacillus mangiferae]